jgi:hypothetical protein
MLFKIKIVQYNISFPIPSYSQSRAFSPFPIMIPHNMPKVVPAQLYYIASGGEGEGRSQGRGARRMGSSKLFNLAAHRQRTICGDGSIHQ